MKGKFAVWTRGKSRGYTLGPMQ